MIVKNNGYLSLEKVKALYDSNVRFAIYQTKKKTNILVMNIFGQYPSQSSFYYPQKDRLEFKIDEGKRITDGVKIFDSINNSIADIDMSGWNNGNQIMSYKPWEFYEV